MSNNNSFLEISWKTKISEEECDILVSLLNELGFDSYAESENEFKAYIESVLFDEDALNNSFTLFPFTSDLTKYSVQLLPDHNWNQMWEEHFDPVYISDLLTIKAPFHTNAKQAKYEIIIQPKMSFGTGHHETTSGMLEMMLNTDFINKSVIDMGCGTGILSVLAEKLGASSILAIDNDPVCVENASEIAMLNNTTKIVVQLGDASMLAGKKARIVLANINRNILLKDMASYHQSLTEDGLLLMSGFYSEDLGMIDEAANKLGLVRIETITKNNWIICSYKLI